MTERRTDISENRRRGQWDLTMVWIISSNCWSRKIDSHFHPFIPYHPPPHTHTQILNNAFPSQIMLTLIMGNLPKLPNNELNTSLVSRQYSPEFSWNIWNQMPLKFLFSWSWNPKRTGKYSKKALRSFCRAGSVPMERFHPRSHP